MAVEKVDDSENLFKSKAWSVKGVNKGTSSNYIEWTIDRRWNFFALFVLNVYK